MLTHLDCVQRSLSQQAGQLTDTGDLEIGFLSD